EERVKLRVGIWECLESVNIELKVHHRVTLRIFHVEQHLHGLRKKIMEFGRRKTVRLHNKSVSQRRLGTLSSMTRGLDFQICQSSSEGL
ncbi:hypothetical protein HAX54_018164, partial [Datura stramonium]|nr:hypothetical protein [Datura stramonium]